MPASRRTPSPLLCSCRSVWPQVTRSTSKALCAGGCYGRSGTLMQEKLTYYFQMKDNLMKTEPSRERDGPCAALLSTFSSV